MTGLHLMFRDAAADVRHQADGGGLASRVIEGFDDFTAEGRLLAAAFEPDGSLVDDAQRGVVTIPGIVTPSEQPVTAEHHAHIFRMIRGHLAELDAEVDAGTLPGQIAHFLAENLRRQFL